MPGRGPQPQFTAKERNDLMLSFTRKMGRTHVDRDGVERRDQVCAAVLEEFRQQHPNTRVPCAKTVRRMYNKQVNYFS